MNDNLLKIYLCRILFQLFFSFFSLIINREAAAVHYPAQHFLPISTFTRRAVYVN